MSERNPPVWALRLLEYFAIPSRNEALMGDLTEEFQHGRSACWFWKQAFVAVVRNGRFEPGFGFASSAGWVLQLVAVFLLWRYANVPRFVAIGFGIMLAYLQQRGRRLLAGSTKWREVQRLLRRSDGPFNYRGVPLWSLIAFDEFADYLVTYLLMSAAIGPFNLKSLIFCEVLWLIAHTVVHRVVLRRRMG